MLFAKRAGPTVERRGLRDDSVRLAKWGIQTDAPDNLLLPALLGRKSRTLYRENAHPRISAHSDPNTPNQIASVRPPTSRHTPAYIPLTADSADATAVRLRAHRRNLQQPNRDEKP